MFAVNGEDCVEEYKRNMAGPPEGRYQLIFMDCVVSAFSPVDILCLTRIHVEPLVGFLPRVCYVLDILYCIEVATKVLARLYISDVARDFAESVKSTVSNSVRNAPLAKSSPVRCLHDGSPHTLHGD